MLCLGGVVWNAAPVLCEWMRTQEIAGRSVLTIGDGTGCCGLYAAGLAAARVVLTDGDEACVDLMRCNLEKNLSLLTAASTAVLPLLWGCETSALPPEPFDWIVGSDIVWGSDDDAHAALSRTLADLLQPRGSCGGEPLAAIASATSGGKLRPSPRVILALEHGLPEVPPSSLGTTSTHFLDETLEQFRDAARACGLRLQIITDGHGHDGRTSTGGSVSGAATAEVATLTPAMEPREDHRDLWPAAAFGSGTVYLVEVLVVASAVPVGVPHGDHVAWAEDACSAQPRRAGQ